MGDDNGTFELSRRKALAGLGTIGAASAGAGLGTSAFFSDTESFNNNMITAGELDLAVDYVVHEDQGDLGGTYTINSFEGTVNGSEAEQAVTLNGPGTAMSQDLDDLKPGDSGYSYFCFTIDDNPAYLWACGELTANDENGQNEAEEDDGDGESSDSTGGDPGEGEGELADAIQVTVSYCEVDDTGTKTSSDDDDVEITSGSLAEVLAELNGGIPLDAAESSGISSPGDQTEFAGTSGDAANNPCLCFDWEVPTDVGNEIQSDSVAFDLQFSALQARHNDGTENPCGETIECQPCSFDTSATGDGASNLLSVGPDTSAGYPAIDARVRVDTPRGRDGDLTGSNFAICEDGCGQTIENVAFEPGGLVDIVVVFDDTGSMGNEIDALQTEVNDLTSDIESAGIDARYALVSFKDSVELDTDFTDASNFQSAVNGLSASGGGDTPEDNLDALAVGTGNAPTEGGASISAFRSGAQRIVIDITDAPAHDETDSRTRFSRSEVESFLDDGNFTYYAVSPPESLTGPVSKETIANNVDDGTWIDIDGAEFDVILDDIVAAITEPAYVLSYTTTNPATDGSARTVDLQISGVDADDDGTSDDVLYEEGGYTAPT